jgi:proteasome lid subunit RPN8/RPN11
VSIEPIEHVIPQQLDITFYAFRKAVTYAQLVAQERGGGECMGYLLTDRESANLLVDDVLLAPRQRVTRSSVQVEGSAVLAAGREIEARGKRAVGWWHSHADMSAFHSCIDDENSEKLLHDLAPANLRYAQAAMPVQLQPIEDGFQLRSSAGVMGVLQPHSPLTTHHSPLTSSEATLHRIIPIGVAFSMVVNVRGQTYVEVACKQWCGFCQREEIKTQRVPLRLVEQESEPPLDKFALRAEVRRKVWTPVVGWTWNQREHRSPSHHQQDERRWQRLIRDADAVDDVESHAAAAKEIPIELPPSVVPLLEQLLADVRAVKSLLTALAQNAEKPS